ncbi:hypothetical protein DL769_000702 [Monosporascus sp. CRB-8-3]|nr:hypothetical protein DL769_000702 [Monosporascus sp. CRB-8-3]
MSVPRDNATAQGVRDWLRLYFQYRNRNVDVSEFKWTRAQIRGISRHATYVAFKEHGDLTETDAELASLDVKEILSESTGNTSGIIRVSIGRVRGLLQDHGTSLVVGLCATLFLVALCSGYMHGKQFNASHIDFHNNSSSIMNVDY